MKEDARFTDFYNDRTWRSNGDYFGVHSTSKQAENFDISPLHASLVKLVAFSYNFSMSLKVGKHITQLQLMN